MAAAAAVSVSHDALLGQASVTDGERWGDRQKPGEAHREGVAIPAGTQAEREGGRQVGG